MAYNTEKNITQNYLQDIHTHLYLKFNFNQDLLQIIYFSFP